MIRVSAEEYKKTFQAGNFNLTADLEFFFV
jgi:hypothetical protein